MGLLASKPFDARRRAQQGGTADPKRAQARVPKSRRRWYVGCISLFLAGPLTADPIRLAVFAAPLSREGPGLLLRDMQRDDAQIDAVLAILDEVRPDILVLPEFDVDLDNIALSTFANLTGLPFDYLYAEMGNSGAATPFDLDQNGKTGEPRDAMGYGQFAGDDGLAILSRFPISQVRSFADLLWMDLPNAQLPDPWPEELLEHQRLSSSSHLAVAIETDQGTLTLLAYAGTPPIFDGVEDFNGLRGGDQARLWAELLNGGLGPVPKAPVVIGKANIDPLDGEGRHEAINALLAHPALQDPRPSSRGAALAADPDHRGDPALDTADWPDGAPGNLRVSYILPPADWQVMGAGVFWPAPDDALAALLGSDGLAAGPHRLVWVDISR